MGGLQIPRWLGSDPLSAWWLGLAPATLEFWVRFPNERNQGKQTHPVLKYRVPHGSQICNYGEAQSAGASWRAHDGRRQRGTACPHLYRYRLTHTYCSLARLPPTHPFVGAPILQRHFQVPWRARLPRPPPSHMHAGWMVSATKTPTSSATSQGRPV